KINIFRRDFPFLEQVLIDIFLPVLPIITSRRVYQNDRQDVAFPRLDKRQGLHRLIMSSEPTGEECRGTRFLNKHQFSGKKEAAVYKTRIFPDKLVRRLLKRQLNVDAEAVIFPRPFVSGLHDTRAGTRDDHKALLGDLLGKIKRLFVLRMFLGDASGTEDRDFTLVAIAFEDPKPIPQLSHSAREDLGVATVQLRVLDL